MRRSTHARHGGRCTVTLKAGAVTIHAKSGPGKFAFSGRIGGHRRLAPGTYRVTVIATNSRGAASAAQTLALTVLTG